MTDLKAGAMEIQLVGTCVGDVAETIEDGITGRIVSPGDAGGMAAALGGICHCPKQGMEMGRRARKRVQARFSFESSWKRIEALYGELIGET